MSRLASLDYAIPSPRRWVRAVHVTPSVGLLAAALGLLIGDICVLALPAFGTIYISSPLRPVGHWAYFWLVHSRWPITLFAGAMMIGCWHRAPASLALRMARSIAVGLAVYHWFFAPSAGAYGRLLWGAC